MGQFSLFLIINNGVYDYMVKKICFCFICLFLMSCDFDSSNSSDDDEIDYFSSEYATVVIDNYCDWDICIQFVPVNTEPNKYSYKEVGMRDSSSVYGVRWFKEDCKTGELYDVIIQPSLDSRQSYLNLGTYSFYGKVILKIKYDSVEKQYYIDDD